MRVADGFEESLAAKFTVLFPHLDERQRRLLMGAEARVLGHGGIRVVARAAGVREATGSLGVGELDGGAEPLGRARKPGGGRKRLADLDPGLRPALLALVEPDERGDPMSPLRWTAKSLRALAAELTRQGHRAGADTVADLLREEGFSLQGNAKTIEGNQVPDRDAQFRYLNEQVREYRDAGEPVISVDTKKKELVGNYRNGGREWRPAGEPVHVKDHDFPDQELGKAIPYGIYDLAADAGWVNVGTDHDTAGFAVESIRRWWKDAGRTAYPDARRLLINADSGGSKWNKIEHRLFSCITMNWRGRPLTSHEVIVAAISATTTRAGLRVRAELDTGTYPSGVKISDEQMAALPLHRHHWHGDWNYTLRPEPPAPPPAPAAGARPGRGERPGWAHPALTGMTAGRWDQLTTALAIPYQAQREAGLHIARGGPASRRPAGGHPAALTLAEKTLVTIMRQRLGVPQPVLAELFGVSANTIGTAERQIKPLLARAGHTIEPATAQLTTLADLTAYATSQGITLTPKTKPAR